MAPGLKQMIAFRLAVPRLLLSDDLQWEKNEAGVRYSDIVNSASARTACRHCLDLQNIRRTPAISFTQREDYQVGFTTVDFHKSLKSITRLFEIHVQVIFLIIKRANRLVIGHKNKPTKGIWMRTVQ